MCIETMDTRSKHVRQTDCLLTVKPGSKLMRTIRKYLRREEKQRRSQLAKLTRALLVVGDIEKKKKKEKKKESVWCEEEERRNHAATQPSGAMAPQNTTQYLMGNVYEDMTTHVSAAHLYSESPAVCAPLDSDYESCLAFQQRDFEEVFNLSW